MSRLLPVDLENGFRELFAREWYTNHGPLARQLEAEVESWLGVPHAIGVATPGVALTMALESWVGHTTATIRGHHHPDILCAMHWAGVTPLAEPSAGSDADEVSPPITVHVMPPFFHGPLPRFSDTEKLRRGPVLIDASRGLARVAYPSLKLDAPGRGLVVLALGSNPIDAQGTAMILLGDGAQAEVLRNIRSSYGVRTPMTVTKTANGRLSEAQALFARVWIAEARKL